MQELYKVVKAKTFFMLEVIIWLWVQLELICTSDFFKKYQNLRQVKFELFEKTMSAN